MQRVLVYVQHLLGIGHLMRARLIAEALAARGFDTHLVTGGMPIGLHEFCLSSRRATARLHPDGRVEFRDDPDWFTDYSRRTTVEWGKGAATEAAE